MYRLDERQIRGGVFMDGQAAEKNGGFFSFIEKVGNKIPHPVYLFIYLSMDIGTGCIVDHVLSWDFCH